MRLLLAAIIVALAAPAYAQQTPAEISKLADSAFAQFQCTVLAGFSKGPNVEAHFDAGYDDMRQFLTRVRAMTDKKLQKEAVEDVPMIISMALGGPNADFEIGRVYSAILQYVDDVLRERETWTHQKNDPSATMVEPEVVQMRAENKYREKNCSLLVR